jgi:glycosyltransferase involved in cell wall biosynthesis
METCGRLQVPYATVVQCNSESWWPDDRSAAALANSYRGARRVFCVSRHNLGLLERQLGEPLTNAEVIWNPWGVAGGEPPPAPEGTDSINMACVARLDPNAKGQDILFEVLAQPVWRERRVFLNLYGGGPCEQSLRKLAQGMDLKNIAFHGHVADIRGVWQANHLLVLPSRFEGLPLSLVEAMWCARPAVVTDVGGCAEACVDGETGFVAAAPTAHSFGEALERAWQSRTRLRMMGLAARERIEEIFPPDPVGEFCERVKNIVSQGRRNKATS